MKHTIGHWMKHQVVSIGPDATLIEAAKLLAERKVGTLPVVDKQGQLVGIITMRKLVKFFLPDFINVMENVSFVRDFGAIDMPSPVDIKKAAKTKLTEVMQEPTSVEEDDSLMRTLALMSSYDINDIPVVKAGRLVGIASRVDIGRAFLQTWIDKSSKAKESTRLS